MIPPNGDISSESGANMSCQWMINPTKQTYAAMPAWLRPTVTQITTPHAAWIDNIPW